MGSLGFLNARCPRKWLAGFFFFVWGLGKGLGLLGEMWPFPYSRKMELVMDGPSRESPQLASTLDWQTSLTTGEPRSFSFFMLRHKPSILMEGK